MSELHTADAAASSKFYVIFRCRGIYLVAADQDDAEGWVDALLLLSHLLRAGRIGGLQTALSVRR